jgi:hypothetical protein
VDKTAIIYAGIGVAASALFRIIPILLQRWSEARAKAKEAKLFAFLAQHSPESARHRSRGTVPDTRRSTTDAQALPALEGQLRNAIFNADTRERLIKDALRHANGNRAAAIRKVLSDLHAENNRWS